jgi:hypothetical protein
MRRLPIRIPFVRQMVNRTVFEEVSVEAGDRLPHCLVVPVVGRRSRDARNKFSRFDTAPPAIVRDLSFLGLLEHRRKRTPSLTAADLISELFPDPVVVLGGPGEPPVAYPSSSDRQRDPAPCGCRTRRGRGRRRDTSVHARRPAVRPALGVGGYGNSDASHSPGSTIVDNSEGPVQDGGHGRVWRMELPVPKMPGIPTVTAVGSGG